MTTIDPNPYSPYANALPDVRHIFPSPIFFPQAEPGVLALTACEGMAVVPDALIETEPGAPLPEGLCPECVAVMHGGRPPKRGSSQCSECGTATWHGEWCALCRQDKHEAWWPTRPGAPRTNTPDESTVDADGRKSTRIKVKRACNGCGQKLGDADNRDVDENGNLTDVRGECAHCRPLVELEAAGCRTWELTPRSLARIDDEIDRLGVYAKGYWEDVDGKLTVTGLRVGTGEARVVARFGDWIVRHPDGRFTVHEAPKAVEEQPAEACGKCRAPFDPADTRFDGRAQYRETPYCRSCVDRCHDNEIADHRCVICA